MGDTESMATTFQTPEYQADGRFKTVQYTFEGSEDAGWRIIRQASAHQSPQVVVNVGAGYRLLATRYCGVCATDLARRHLPFSLPQITGHEISAVDKQPVTVEINASHAARGEQTDCPYCKYDLHRHCPDRLTIGIDRLPGGFAPWLLAPRHGIIPLPSSVSAIAGCFVEPYAAAMRALQLSPPDRYQQIAVLGPRRLGMLILSALNAYREQHNLDYELVAIVRHNALRPHCLTLGADRVDMLDACKADSFDLVFDTTGSPQGLAHAIRLSRHEVHLKSTHGKPVFGFNSMSQMVVDEISLAGLQSDWSLPESLPRRAMVAADTTSINAVHRCLPDADCMDPDDALPQTWPLAINAFDAVVINELPALDNWIAADKTSPKQLRPAGLVLLNSKHGSSGDPLSLALHQKPLMLRTSRCGDFRQTLALWQQFPRIPALLEDQWLSHILSLDTIEQAFSLAADSQRSRKIVVNTLSA